MYAKKPQCNFLLSRWLVFKAGCKAARLRAHATCRMLTRQCMKWRSFKNFSSLISNRFLPPRPPSRRACTEALQLSTNGDTLVGLGDDGTSAKPRIEMRLAPALALSSYFEVWLGDNSSFQFVNTLAGHLCSASAWTMIEHSQAEVCCVMRYISSVKRVP